MEKLDIYKDGKHVGAEYVPEGGLPARYSAGELQSATLSSTEGPKSGVKTSSFLITIITTVIGALITFAVSKGWVTSENAPNVSAALIGIVIAVVGYVNATYIAGRTEVSKAKAAAASPNPLPQIDGSNNVLVGSPAVATAPTVSEPANFAGIGSFLGGGLKLNTVATMIDMAVLFIGQDSKPKTKKANVIKALKAASAAIRAYKGEDEEA